MRCPVVTDVGAGRGVSVGAALRYVRPICAVLGCPALVWKHLLHRLWHAAACTRAKCLLHLHTLRQLCGIAAQRRCNTPCACASALRLLCRMICISCAKHTMHSSNTTPSATVTGRSTQKQKSATRPTAQQQTQQQQPPPAAAVLAAVWSQQRRRTSGGWQQYRIVRSFGLRMLHCCRGAMHRRTLCAGGQPAAGWQMWVWVGSRRAQFFSGAVAISRMA